MIDFLASIFYSQDILYAMINDLIQDIAVYEKMQEKLEAQFIGKWVLIHDKVLIGQYDSFAEAAEYAVKNFGQGPYLIRQVGAPAVTLSASVMYHIKHV